MVLEIHDLNLERLSVHWCEITINNYYILTTMQKIGFIVISLTLYLVRLTALKENRIKTRLTKFCWISNTGGCLLSREKAVKDVNSRVGFCFLVGVQFNFDWSIFSRPIQIEINPD